MSKQKPKRSTMSPAKVTARLDEQAGVSHNRHRQLPRTSSWKSQTLPPELEKMTVDHDQKAYATTGSVAQLWRMSKTVRFLSLFV